MEYNGFLIEGDKTYGMKHVKAQGRGSVPLALRGAYTSYGQAMKAIDSVLAAKEEVDVTPSSTGRDK